MGTTRSTSPNRATCERLKAECARLRRDVDDLRETVSQQRHDLQTQFVRIAEMQAILDETRLEDERQDRKREPPTPVPLYRRTS